MKGKLPVVRTLAATLLAGGLLAAAVAPAARLPAAQRCGTQAQSRNDALAQACRWREAWGDVALMAGTPYFQYDAGSKSHGTDFTFGYEWDVPGQSLWSYWIAMGGRKRYNGRLELGSPGVIEMKNEAGSLIGLGHVDPDGATVLGQDGNTNRILMQPDGSIVNAWKARLAQGTDSGVTHYFPATPEGRALAAEKAGD
jgi:hypothetical protein